VNGTSEICRMDLLFRPPRGLPFGISEGARTMIRPYTALCVISLLFVSGLRLGHTQSQANNSQARQPGKDCAPVANHNAEVMLEIFRAIEQRDAQRLHELFDPGLEMHWPPSLPYGGTHTASTPGPTSWSQTWAPLQPTDAERRMDPRIVSA